MSNKNVGTRLIASKKSPKKAREAVVAGHICLDVFPTLTGDAVLFRPGQTVEAGPVVFSTGGPVSNTGLALHKLGITTRLMGKIGSDLFGQAILQILATHGPELADGMIIAQGEASSYSIILSTPNADRMLIHAPGCNATFGADDVRYDALEKARLFHFGYPPLMERVYSADGAELAAIFQRVKAVGLTTSLDLCMPDPNSAAGRADWRAILNATLPYVDVFLPSAEEILLMLHRPLYDRFAVMPGSSRPLEHITPQMISEMGQQLLDMGAKIVALKLGERGLYLRTANAAILAQMGRTQVAGIDAWSKRELWAPCFTANVVGTTGSGDATIAGFLAGLLWGMSPEMSLEAACAVGACSVEAVDAISGIRTFSETAVRLAKGWPRLPLALDIAIAGWHWDADNEVWVGPLDAHAHT
ncbi:MAG TPA: carbohydrate kinase family protein [Ktedonobacteraceae bacterium]|nr:carbohydrate kinase family protein [Ktedonobacteraceae bacterium]